MVRADLLKDRWDSAFDCICERDTGWKLYKGKYQTICRRKDSKLRKKNALER